MQHKREMNQLSAAGTARDSSNANESKEAAGHEHVRSADGIGNFLSGQQPLGPPLDIEAAIIGEQRRQILAHQQASRLGLLLQDLSSISPFAPGLGMAHLPASTAAANHQLLLSNLLLNSALAGSNPHGLGIDPLLGSLGILNPSTYALAAAQQPPPLLSTARSVARVPATAQDEIMPQYISTFQQVGYRDASLLPDPVWLDRNGVDRTGQNIAAEPFPQKLYRMLSELESEPDGTGIASFLSHGRAFMIHNPKKFVNEVMPKYFRMSRFSSFQRQLNLYDFKRINAGRDKGAYYHELFLKGRPALCTQMKRTKIKGNQQGDSWVGPMSGIGYCEDIDFYSMPPISRPQAARSFPVVPTRRDAAGKNKKPSSR
jgi:hypothetical protein